MNVLGRVLSLGSKAFVALSLISVPALAQSVTGACLYSLDPTAQNAFVISGSTAIYSGCSLVVESNATQAFDMQGSETLYLQNHAQVGVVGGWQLSGNTIKDTISNLTVQPVKIASPGDPLASIQAPTSGTIVATSHKYYDMNSKPPNNTIPAGVYCGGLAIGNTNGATFTLSPGTYVMAGGGFTVNSQGIVSGSGVTIYNTSSSGWGCSGSSSYTPIVISGQTKVTLSAPTTGPLAGIVIFGNRTGCATPGSCQDQVNGGSTSNFNGAVYVKSDNLLFSGSNPSGSCMVAVADIITINGNSTFGDTGCAINPVSVSVSPHTASLYAGQSQQFAASVTNSNNSAVTWTISPSGSGAITSAGLYTAPGTVTTQQTVTVTATSQADTSKSASATVTLLVRQTTPTITWATPAAITYGTALSATQLNATASVPGTFAYTPAAGTILGAGTQTLSVTFTPTDTTDYTTATSSVHLTVNKATPAITWAVPPAISYGTPLGLSQLDATSTVAGSFAYSPASGTVLTAGTQTLSTTFTPTDSADYVTATGSVQLTVNKATPAITWPSPAAIGYGTALSATQLDASSTVAGSFAYSPATGTVLTAGTQTLSTTFTPTDTADYNTATATTSLLVNKATPAIAWPAPAAITYGIALNATQLDASSTVAGSFAYSPSAGSVLPAGTQTLSTTLTPTDTADYGTATSSVALTVNKAAPAITWAAPAAITYGTALAATQLNASSSVPGTFSYTPAAGTILSAGTQTLSVTFTPTDTADYATATTTVSLIVNKATPPIAWVAPGAISYGTALSATQLNATSTVQGTFSYTPTLGAVLPAGTQTLSATLTPTDTADYTTATATVSILVNKATPVISWTPPAAITYGTALSATQLNATSPVAGTFAYAPSLGAVLSVGTQSLSVAFTPTDSADYTTASSTVTLTVNTASSVLTWATPAPITYGAALSATQLNASATIPGTLVYSPAVGTVLTAGTQTLSVTFTPTDTTDYTMATSTVSLTVNKATPTITWPTPAAITSGTALSTTQLDASSSVAGSFAYSPTAGTVPPAGTQILSVTLTPTDAVDYTTATGSVTLIVNSPSVSVAVNPTSATLNSGQTQQFTATVSNTSNTAVNWTVSPSNSGSIDQTGLYKAPATIGTQQTLTITATSQADSTQSAAATVTLTPSTQCTTSGYSFARVIVIDHTKVPNTDQSNFPFLYNTTDSSFATTTNGGHVTNANGYDIVFSSDPNGTARLDHELEEYNPLTGQVIAWIRIPTLSHTSDTVIYMLYGNSSISAQQQNPNGVWDSNYMGVWHVADGNAPTLNDSTSNGNNAINNGATATAGQVDGAMLTGGTGYADLGTPASLANLALGNATFSAWVNPSVGNGIIMGKDDNDRNQGWALSLDGSNSVGFTVVHSNTDLRFKTSTHLPTGSWSYITVALNGTPASSQATIYVNGVPAASATGGVGDTLDDSAQNAYLANANYGDYAYQLFNGSLDEFRISRTIRSADWIATEYNNQSSPATFYAVRDEFFSIAPNPVRLYAAQTRQFTATAINSCSAGVNWTISPSDAGSISASGLYTAPSTIASPQTVTLTATSTTDQSKSSSAVITLSPPVAVSVTPTTANLTNGGQQQQFTANVINADNAGVTWTISPVSVGSIDANGLYTAPNSVASAQNVTVTATSQADPTKSSSATVSLAPPSLPPAICASTGYSFMRAIVVDHAQVPNTDQVNFPFLFSTTDPAFATTANGGHVTNVNGYDITFSTDPSGQNRLSYELEKYNPITGQVIAWISVPMLSHSVDTILYMFYGNDTVSTSQQNVAGVWDSSYVGVWHAGNGTQLSLADSSSYHNDASNNGALAAPGQIYGGMMTDGNTFATIGTPASLANLTQGNATFSAWVNVADTGGVIMGKEDPDDSQAGWEFDLRYDNGVGFEGIYSGRYLEAHSSGATASVGKWTYVNAVLGGSPDNGGQATLYINGIPSGTATGSGQSGDDSNYPAYMANVSWAWPLQGGLDEFRITKTIRSADWISTEYNNQSSPSTFYQLLSENAVAAAPATAALYASQNEQFFLTSPCSVPSVNWTMAQGVPGTLAPSGLYTAPSSIDAQQTVTVSATSQADGSTIATSTVTLLPPVQVAVSPASATLYTSYSTQQFTANLANATNNSVIWSISPVGIGTIDASGLYSAPNLNYAQTVTVTATSRTDPTKSASATLLLTPLTVSPSFLAMYSGFSSQFTASLPVTWSITSGVGTIDANGVYSAPLVAVSQYVSIVATSQANPSIVAYVTVFLQPPTSGITPASQTLYGGQSQQFSTCMSPDGRSYSCSPSVASWTISPAGVGTITSGGLYTAPATVSSPQTVIVTATDLTNSAISASATITLQAPAITVSPQSSTLYASQSEQFVAGVQNTSNTSVTWSISPAGIGSISASGAYRAPDTIAAQQTVTVTATSQAFPGVSASASVTLLPASCLGKAYANSRSIVIDHNQVPNTDQSNFPFLFSVTDPTLASVANGGHVANSSGNDILFTLDPAGLNKLDFELEKYDPVAGQIIAWIRIPVLSHVSDTQMYMFYGNAAITTPQQNPAGVWDANYMGVWHLPNGTTLSVADSTTNQNNGTNNGAVATTGQIDGGMQTVSYPDWVTLGNPASLNNLAQGNATFSAWVNTTQGIGGALMSKDQNYAGWQINVTPNLNLEYTQNGSIFLDSQGTVGNGTWSYVVVAVANNSSQTQVTTYINGVPSGTATVGYPARDDSASPAYLAQGVSGFREPNPIYGSEDEFRISNNVRSADWIAAEYNNQKTGSTFFKLNPEGMTLTPTSVILYQSQSQQFQDLTYANCSDSLNWTETPSGMGTLTQNGLYTAPSQISAQTTVTVTATSQVTPTASSSAIVTLMPPVAVSVSPASATLNDGNQTVQFSSTVLNTSNTAVTWSIVPSDQGTITAGGLYTAPSNINVLQTVTVTVTSQFDPTKSASAIITLSPPILPQLNCASTGYAYERSIVINHDKVANSDLIDFPFLFSFTDPELAVTVNGGHVTNFRGNDIFFTSDPTGATKLDLEIEQYNPVTGQIVAWIRIPKLSHSQDSIIYMFYGNSNVTASPQNPGGVWRNSYRGVWHLPNGITLSSADSTAGGNNGTPGSGVTATVGQIDGGARFDGSSSGYISVPPSTAWDFSNDVTVSAWVKTTDNGKGILDTQNNNPLVYLEIGGTTVGGAANKAVAYFRTNNGNVVVANGAITVNDGTWHHIQAVRSTGDSAKIYVDGVLDTSTPYSDTGAINTSAAGVNLGGLGSPYNLNGIVDEVRISSAARSADWIGAEYRNQSNPTTFFTVNPENGQILLPASVDLYAGQQQQFIAPGAPGCSLQTVLWIMPAGSQGSLSASGLYSAPPAVQSKHSVTISATTFGLSGKTYSATINLLPPIAISVTPQSASLTGGQTMQFSASVLNSSNPAVSWSISPSVGSIDTSGNYTAPGSLDTEQTVIVTATSAADPAQFASATITLLPPPPVLPVTISITPTSASLHAGGTLQFTATVANTSNQGVTWSVAPFGLGSVNAHGLYTAPPTLSGQQTVTVTAKSTADPTQTASAMITLSSTECAAAGYAYQRSVVINHTKIPNSDQLNFPILINSADPAFANIGNGGHVTSANGYDIIFSADPSGKTRLDHELEHYDPVSGQVIAWVRVPVLSHTQDTVVYIFYGNPNVTTSQENVAGVWDQGYRGVWHLPNGATLSANDSTGNHNNGAIQNATAMPGEIYGGAAFDGSTSEIATNYIQNAVTAYSIEAWISTSSTNAAIFVDDRGSGGHSLTFGLDGNNGCGSTIGCGLQSDPDPTGKLMFGDDGDGVFIGAESSVRLNDGGWHHVVGTWSAPAQTEVLPSQFALYIDGKSASVGNQPWIGYDSTPLNGSGGTLIGTGFGNYLGQLDELRISTTARPADWVATEFNNQSSPSTFYTLQREVTLSVDPNAVILFPSQSQQFTAVGSCNTGITWSMPLGSPGILTTSGLYTAPPTISAPQIVTVTAGQSGTGSSAYATVTLMPAVTVNVSPATVTLNANQTQQFVAGVTNASNPTVAWTVSPAGSGSIDANGLYTAPTTVTAQQTVTITATSIEDIGQSASAAITLQPNSCASTGYGYQRVVVIDHAKVQNTDQVNFPFLFNTVDPELATTSNGGHVESANGYDIFFSTDPGGQTRLDHEIEQYDPVTGHLIAWVRLPLLSHSTDTVLYVFYGNPTLSAPVQNSTGVWDSNFTGVYHFAGGTNPSYADSTGNGNGGTPTSVSSGVGIVDGGTSFSGSSYLQIPAADFPNFPTGQYSNLGLPSTATTTPFTATFGVWFKTASPGGIITQVPALSCSYVFGICFYMGPTEPGYYDPAGWNGVVLYVDENGNLSSSAGVSPRSYTDNQWHHVVLTYGTDGTDIMYVDGEPVTTTTGNLPVGYSDAYSYFIGTSYTLLGYEGNWDWLYFNGNLDELAVSKGVRSADWIKTQYNNQSSPGTFYKFYPYAANQIAPPAVSLYAAQTQQFAATGLCGSEVSWSMPSGAPGTLSSSGLYTAPEPIPAQQSVAVTGMNLLTGVAVGTSTVTLLPPAPPLVLSAGAQSPYSVGTTQSFSAALKYPDGTPVLGVSVNFNIAGPNSRYGTVVTDQSGVATFTYTGSYSGTDTIQASAIVDEIPNVSNTLTALWMVPVVNATPTVTVNLPSAIGVGGLVGAFTNSAGSVIEPIAIGANARSFVVPSGATQLQLGVNDRFFRDNTGIGFTVSVNGSPVKVPSTAMPWTWQTGGLNANYEYGLKDGTAPVVAATNLSAGAVIAIAYQSGTVSSGFPLQTLTGANGDANLIPGTLESQGAYFPTLYMSPSAYPVGQPIPVIALVTDANGLPVSGIAVSLGIAGANPGELLATTDATGNATFLYTGVYAGADSLQAQASLSGVNLASGTSNVVWSNYPTPPAALKIALSLFGKENDGQVYQVVVTDSAGNPVQNVDVGAYVYGIDNFQMDSQTDITGHATFGYFHSKSGTYNLVAVESQGRNVVLSNTVTGNWTPASVSSGNQSNTVSVSISAPSSVAMPNSLPLTGTVTDTSGIVPTALWTEVTGPGVVTFADASQAVTSATFSAPGTYTLQLSATDTKSSAATQISVVVTAAPVTINQTPQGWIGAPLYGATVSGLVPITVAPGVNLQSGTLVYYPADNPNNVTVLNANTSGTGQIGLLDTTTLVNGTYWLQLHSTQTDGDSEYDVVLVTVAGDYKPGRVTSTVTDLVVPATGIAIQIQRTYDSLNASQIGDFGYGWNLSTNVDLSVDPQGDVTFTLGGKRKTFFLTPQSLGSVFSFLYMPLYSAEPGFFGTLTDAGSGCGVSLDFVNRNGNGWICSDGNPFSPTTYVYTDPSGNAYTISANGGLRSILDKNGNGLTITAKGITSTTGLSVPFVRDSSGRITQITDPQGHDYLYTYDNSGNLATVTYPNTPQASAYTYDPNHLYLSGTDFRKNPLPSSSYFTASETDPNGLPLNGRLKSTTDGLGETTSYAYDLVAQSTTITYPPNAGGNVSKATKVYDSLGDLLTSTDPLGHTTTRVYDGKRNLLSLTDPLGHTTKYVYDFNGNKSSTTYPATATSTNTTSKAVFNQYSEPISSTDELGNVRNYNYDANFNPQSVTDTFKGKPATVISSLYNNNGTMAAAAFGYDIAAQPQNASQFTYDANGNMTSATDPLGRTTSFTYDSMGHKLTMTVPAPSSGGGVSGNSVGSHFARANLHSEGASPSSSVSTITYVGNALGQIIEIIAPLNQITYYQYDANGNLISVTDPKGNTYTAQYDALNRVISITLPTQPATSWSFSYDFNNNLIDVTDPGGHVRHNVYDLAGRLASVTFAFGTSSAATYSLTYFDDGHVESVTDPLGHTTNYTYDAAGNVTSQAGPQGIFQMAYDNAKNLIAVTDANGNTTQYSYDSRKNLIAAINPDSTTRSYTYDSAGNLTSATDPLGHVVQYAYDAGNQLQSLIQANHPIPAQNSNSYGHDNDGNLNTWSDENGHTTQAVFDALNRVVSETLPDGMHTQSESYDLNNNLVSLTSFNGKTTSFTYDDVNRLLTRSPDTTVSEPTVSYTYTTNGLPATMTDGSGVTTYTYDNQDRLITKATPGGTLNYTYDAAGNVASMHSSDANGASVSYTYDNLNRLSTVVDNRLTSGQNTTTYTYDAASNLATATYPNGLQSIFTYDQLNRVKGLATPVSGYLYQRDANGNKTISRELNGRTVNWTYDGIDQLTAESVSSDPNQKNGSVSYWLDAVGNRLSDTSTLSGVNAGSFSYDVDDRLSAEVYDSNGNVLSTGGKSYVYDSQNQLTSANAGAVQIVYDGWGNRVAKSASGSTTRYLIDDLSPTGYPQVVQESVNGAIQRVYTYGLQRISQNQVISNTWTPSFYEYDGGGSVRLLTDSAGAVTDSYDYDAFGNEIRTTGSTPNEYLYRGEQYDADLSMYYLRARYYNPATGRFLSQDPYAGNTFDPPSLHRYRYASGNPANRIDPRGLSDAVEYKLNLSTRALAVTTQLIDFGLTVSCVYSAEAAAIDLVNHWMTDSRFRRGLRITELGLVVGMCGAAISERAGLGGFGEEGGGAFGEGEGGGPPEGPPGSGEFSIGCPECFAAGTLIHTERGNVPVEQIKVGDRVFARNRMTSQPELMPVTSLVPKHRGDLLALKIEGEAKPLRSSFAHPFWVKHDASDTGRWIEARDLVSGELLETINGDWRKIVSVSRVEGQETVYNFTVDKDHDYFVGETGFLVHNAPPCVCKFGTAPFGNAMHEKDYFGPVLAEQTGTNPSDWIINPPNFPGVDATYTGPANLGFKYAELKSINALKYLSRVKCQIGNWGYPEGETSLWLYNANGIIGQSGISY